MSNHIGDLTHDPRNARKHNPRNVGQIVNAMHDVGAARSIVIDEDGVILAGNATIEAAAQAGIERLRIVDADGEEIIAVRRSGLTPEQKTRLALADNRAAELAEWDTDVLAELSAEVDLSGMWHDWELAALVGGETDDPNAEWGGMPEFDNDQLEAKQIIVKFTRTDDIARFTKVIGQPVTMDTKSIWYPPREAVNTDKAFVGDES